MRETIDQKARRLVDDERVALLPAVTRGQRHGGRALTWYDAFPILERLARHGQLVRVVLYVEPGVPRYREVGS